MRRKKKNREETLEALFGLEPLSYKSIKKGDVVVVLSSDVVYEPHLWVTLTTMVESADKVRNYHLYILDGGIRERPVIEDIFKRYGNFKIEFVDMTAQFDGFFESRSISKAAYYRLAIFFLFENFNRVVYLDADSYILSDIAELFDVNMGDKQIAGVRDSINYEIPWREKRIKYSEYSGKAVNYFTNCLLLTPERLAKYFSSGVLVFNMDQIDLDRKKEDLRMLLLRDYYCHDQDILNLLFDENQVYLLGREWNYFNSGSILREEDFLLEEERENYLGSKLKPKIVSYVLKPWLKENLDKPYVSEYWRKLEKSPYYHEVQERMRRNTKLRRFLKLSLKDKILFLTSEEALQKYRSILNNQRDKKS
jgi:lipopolysaccharide biosynthesis glycosyltransferase